MADNCWRIRGQARSHDGRRALIGMPGAGRHRRAGQARSRCLTPAWVFGFGGQGSGAPKKRNYRPRRITGQQPEGSRCLASRPISPGGCVALSWRVPGGLRPGEQKGALPEPYGRQIRGLALFAPVAGERQPRPRSHGYGHAVHPFITLPASYARARAAHESPGHMVAQLNVTVCDMPCSWLTRAYPPGLERSLRSDPLEVSRSVFSTALLNLRARRAAVESAACPPSSCASSLRARTSPRL